MEREIKLLREKVQDLSQENAALREINVQFQLDNFKLQQKIKNLENSRVITFNESSFEAEYLEEVHLDTRPKSNTRQRPSRQSAKRSYQNAFENELDECQNVSEMLSDIKQEVVAEEIQIEEEYIPEPQSEIEGFDNDDVSPKEAATIIFKIAAKRGQLDKIKTLDPGKQKDA